MLAVDTDADGSINFITRFNERFTWTGAPTDVVPVVEEIREWIGHRDSVLVEPRMKEVETQHAGRALHKRGSSGPACGQEGMHYDHPFSRH